MRAGMQLSGTLWVKICLPQSNHSQVGFNCIQSRLVCSVRFSGSSHNNRDLPHEKGSCIPGFDPIGVISVRDWKYYPSVLRTSYSQGWEIRALQDLTESYSQGPSINRNHLYSVRGLLLFLVTWASVTSWILIFQAYTRPRTV